MLHYLAARWKEEGKEVVYYNGLHSEIEGDILIPQIDLTHTPPEYIEAINAFDGLVLNRNVHDISKQAVSKHLIGPDEPCDGEVIVKPNLSYGGIPELRLRSIFHRASYVLSNRMKLAKPKYLVFPSSDAVPRKYRRSQKYVLEKYLPERNGQAYILRQTSFLGDCERSIEICSDQPLLKRNNNFTRRIVETPPEVHKVRELMGLIMVNLIIVFTMVNLYCLM